MTEKARRQSQVLQEKAEAKKAEAKAVGDMRTIFGLKMEIKKLADSRDALTMQARPRPAAGGMWLLLAGPSCCCLRVPAGPTASRNGPESNTCL